MNFKWHTTLLCSPQQQGSCRHVQTLAFKLYVCYLLVFLIFSRCKDNTVGRWVHMESCCDLPFSKLAHLMLLLLFQLPLNIDLICAHQIKRSYFQNHHHLWSQWKTKRSLLGNQLCWNVWPLDLQNRSWCGRKMAKTSLSQKDTSSLLMISCLLL